MRRGVPLSVFGASEVPPSVFGASAASTCCPADWITLSEDDMNIEVSMFVGGCTSCTSSTSGSMVSEEVSKRYSPELDQKKKYVQKPHPAGPRDNPHGQLNRISYASLYIRGKRRIDVPCITKQTLSNSLLHTELESTVIE